MSRTTKKQALKKTRQHLQEAQNKIRALKGRLGAEEESLTKYIGGVTQFGLFALRFLTQRNKIAHSATGMLLAEEARRMGLVAYNEKIEAFEMTHVCKEQSGEEPKTEA